MVITWKHRDHSFAIGGTGPPVFRGMRIGHRREMGMLFVILLVVLAIAVVIAIVKAIIWLALVAIAGIAAVVAWRKWGKPAADGVA